MFVGHYGPSFLVKRAEPRIPLWLLFLAVQLLDVFWALLVFLGIERVRIVPGFTRTNALDLYSMPYTHSLPAALVWASVAGLGYGALARSRRAGLLVAAAVFSHWPLDLVVHRPDLALWDDTAKVGLGLWDYPFLTLGLEGALLFGSMALYMAVSHPRLPSATSAIPLFGAAILALQGGMLFSPPPPSADAMASTALGAYAFVATSIAWLERGRQAGPEPRAGETA